MGMMRNIKYKIVDTHYDIDKEVHVVVYNDGIDGKLKIKEHQDIKTYNDALELLKKAGIASKNDIKKLEEYISQYQVIFFKSSFDLFYFNLISKSQLLTLIKTYL